MNSPKSLYDSDCEKKAVEYGELLNDMADVLDLPTGSTPSDVLDAVKEMRDDWAVSRSAMDTAQRENARLRECGRRLVCAGSTIYSFARGHATDGALSDWEAAADSFSFLKLPVD